VATRHKWSISEKRVSQIIEAHAKAVLGIRVRPHDLRNLHILHAYTSGVFLESIATQLGLTTLRIFQIINEEKLTRHNYSQFLKRI